jgi:hypothetical protein
MVEKKLTVKLFKYDGFTTFNFATPSHCCTIRRWLQTRRRRVIEATNEAMLPKPAADESRCYQRWRTIYMQIKFSF